jgi:hypothetical protein
VKNFFSFRDSAWDKAGQHQSNVRQFENEDQNNERSTSYQMESEDGSTLSQHHDGLVDLTGEGYHRWMAVAAAGHTDGRATSSGTEMIKSVTAGSIEMTTGVTAGGHNDVRAAGGQNEGRTAGGQSQEVSALARVVQSALSISALDSRAGVINFLSVFDKKQPARRLDVKSWML